jgi:hypothetical protein
VRYWEVEAEWGTYWKGTVGEYLDLLRVARRAITENDPEARVILQGFLMMGVFDGAQEEADLEQHMARLLGEAKLEEILRDFDELLSRPELFDAIEFHSLGDWTEIIGAARFLRGRMARHGYQKPIWAGDVNFSVNPMIWWGRPFFPYVIDQKSEILAWIKAVNEPGNLRHEQAIRWFRAEQACFTAKKIVCSMGEGLAGINMGNLEDWPQFALVPGITGTASMCGLIDIEGFGPTDRKPVLAWAPRIPGQGRPAYWTMKLLVERLSPYTAADRLDLGAGIHAYRFGRPLVWSRVRPRVPEATTILWYDDGIGYLPDDTAPEVTATVPTRASQASLVRIITVLGQERAEEEPLPVRADCIEVRVGPTPLVILESWSSPRVPLRKK